MNDAYSTAKSTVATLVLATGGARRGAIVICHESGPDDRQVFKKCLKIRGFSPIWGRFRSAASPHIQYRPGMARTTRRNSTMCKVGEEKSIRVKARVGAEAASKKRALTLSFWIACASAITVTSCAPIPCPSGYADPNWCRHSGGGGDGSAGA
jgi:hypothetical protein